MLASAIGMMGAAAGHVATVGLDERGATAIS
jgi:hypothetical protein